MHIYVHNLRSSSASPLEKPQHPTRPGDGPFFFSASHYRNTFAA